MATPIAAEPRIYLTSTDLSPDLLDRLFSTLPPRRAAAARRYLRQEASVQSVLGYCLVRYAIYAMTGQVFEGDWKVDADGKPSLEGAPHFSLSHTKYAVAVALSTDHAVGIDIETVGKHDLRLAERIATPEEQVRVLSAPDPNLALIALWCAKEAEGKRLGTGLKNPKELDTAQATSRVIEIVGRQHLLALSPTAALPEPIWVAPDALLL